MLERLADAYSAEVLDASDVEEDDGALTVQRRRHVASLRVVTIAEGLEMVSLTQMLAWDLPLDATRLRETVAEHATNTLLGTVSLVEKPSRRGQRIVGGASKRNSPRRSQMCCCATTFRRRG